MPILSKNDSAVSLKENLCACGCVYMCHYITCSTNKQLNNETITYIYTIDVHMLHTLAVAYPCRYSMVGHANPMPTLAVSANRSPCRARDLESTLTRCPATPPQGLLLRTCPRVPQDLLVETWVLRWGSGQCAGWHENRWFKNVGNLMSIRLPKAAAW